MKQITSNNPVIRHSSEFQEQIESSLLLMDHLFFLFIYPERMGALELDSTLRRLRNERFIMSIIFCPMVLCQRAKNRS